MKLKLFLSSLLILIISGCSSAPRYAIPSNVDKDNLSKLHIYRTSVAFHSLNPEKPFFYIDGKEVGKLGTAQSISVEVTSGTHTITAKEPILFMPAYENGRLQLNIEPNKEYYIRYSKNFAWIDPVTLTAVGTTTLGLTDRVKYLERR